MKKHYVTYVFIVVIALPIMLELLNINFIANESENEGSGIPSFSLEEGQALKAKTSIGFLINLNADLSNYRKKLDKHYKFKNVLRPVLMKPYTYLKADLFNLNPIPEKVIQGKEGWMFIGDNYSNALSEAIGLSIYTAEELASKKQYYLSKDKWFKENGIDYFMSIAPGKHTIYSDFLPIKKTNSMTKFTQLKEVFLVTDFKLIDLADNYVDHKNERLFYKTDTHWNDMGAFLSYQKLMGEIQKKYPEVEMLTLADFEVEIELVYQKDLTRMLNIKVKEENKILILKKPISKQVVVSKNTSSNHIYFEERYQSSANNLKVLVFGDSFSAALVKYLKESFGVSVFHANLDYNQELILKEKPDIVIQELGERGL